VKKIKVQKLPFGDTTPDGPYYPTVDGANVGEAGRAFWHTYGEAYAVAKRFVEKFR
jgi:hypothetical protein